MTVSLLTLMKYVQRFAATEGEQEQVSVLMYDQRGKPILGYLEHVEVRTDSQSGDDPARLVLIAKQHA